MKKIFYFIIFFLTTLSTALAQIEIEEDSTIVPFYQQIDSVFAGVNLNRMETDYLLEKSLVVDDPAKYRSQTDSAVNSFLWQGMYHTFLGAHVHNTNTFELWDSIELLLHHYDTQSIIPIGILLFEFDRVKPNAIETGLLLVDEIHNKYLQDGNLFVSPFTRDSCFLAAPLKTYTDTGHVTFVVPSRLFKSHYSGIIQSIEIDFDDGQGWRIVVPDVLQVVHYDDEGLKNIRYRVTTDKGEFGGQSSFKNRALYKRYHDLAPPNTIVWYDLEAEEAYMGKKAKGHITISYGCGDGKLRKPLIVVPGFDPPQYVDLMGEEMEDYERFIDGLVPEFRTFLENEGYDLIYINYRNGSDFIQRNAKLVESVIRRVNAEKALNGSDFPNTILAVSMGGLVARYALGEMEDEEEMHDVETFYTLDSPHNGANIPLSFQYGVTHVRGINVYVNFNFIGVPIPLRQFVKPIDLVEEVMGSMAALQMLEDHQYADNYYGRTSLRQSLISELANFGLPSQTSTRGRQIRNLAISNGTDIATNQGFNANDPLISFNKTGNLFIPPFFFLVKPWAFIGLWSSVEFKSLPDYSLGKRLIYAGHFNAILQIPGYGGIIVLANQRARFTNYITNGRDNAPGAFFDLAEFDIPHFPGLTLHQTRFCFIPSVSSAALVSPYKENFYYNINNVWNPTTRTWQNNESEMTNYTVSDIDPVTGDAINTFHTDWTPLNRAFFQDNLLLFPLTIPNFPLLLYNSYFNFSEGTSDRLIEGEIGGNGFLNINVNQPIGQSNPFNNNPFPDIESHYTVYVTGGNCTENPRVDVYNNGTIQVGDNSVGNTADLVFTQGSTLQIYSGGKLVVANNSKLIIEPGAELIFHPGAIIYLEGENAVLEIRGKLQLESGAVFTFTKGAAAIGGYIRFDLSHPSSDISVNGNACKMVFIGNTHAGYSDKVLEIVGGTFRTPDVTQSSTNYLSEFSITTGTITIGANSKLHVSVNSNFNNCIFSGLSLSNSTGLFLPQPDLTTIEGCSFRNLALGLELNLSGINPNYEIELCSFRDNEVGLFSQNGGLNIYNCIFENNSNGWMAFTMNASTVYESSFQSNEYGIYAEGSSSPFLFIEKTDFVNNDFGAYVSSSELTLKCCYFGNNSNRGIFANGLLNLSTLKTVNGKTGGNNAFYNNQIAVQIEGEIYLDEGQNVFRNNGGFSTNTFLTGNLPACNPCSFMSSSWQVYAAENYWDPGYQSSLQVQTFPHPSPASFTGTPHSSFTSSCFLEGFSGMPLFNFARIAPSLKNELNDGEEPAESKVNNTNLVLYPNPANQLVYLKGELKEATLYDMTGRNLGAFTQKNDEIWELNLLGIPPGIYLVTVQMSHRHENIKLIISH